MKISIINGSPKPAESTSELLIGYLTELLESDYIVCKPDSSELQMSEIANSDAVVFVFPLYVDGIPSHLLRFLNKLEKCDFSDNTVVYCIINNGFYEGSQTRVAINQMKCWCHAAGVKWGSGLGVGAGEMLPFLKDVPLGHGPNKNIGEAFRKLSKLINELKSGDDMFISPNWFRSLWRLQGSLFMWLPRAKRNGLKRCELFRRLI